MKNKILMSIVAIGILSTSLSAHYDDYKYKKHIDKGSQFGSGYTNKYSDTYMFSGIDTKYLKEFGRSGINGSDLKYDNRLMRSITILFILVFIIIPFILIIIYL